MTMVKIENKSETIRMSGNSSNHNGIISGRRNNGSNKSVKNDSNRRHQPEHEHMNNSRMNTSMLNSSVYSSDDDDGAHLEEMSLSQRGNDGLEHGDGNDDENNSSSNNNNNNNDEDDNDETGLSLLSEIFPDATREELEELHFGRINIMEPPSTSTSTHTSPSLSLSSKSLPAHSPSDAKKSERSMDIDRNVIEKESITTKKQKQPDVINEIPLSNKNDHDHENNNLMKEEMVENNNYEWDDFDASDDENTCIDSESIRPHGPQHEDMKMKKHDTDNDGDGDTSSCTQSDRTSRTGRQDEKNDDGSGGISNGNGNGNGNDHAYDNDTPTSPQHNVPANANNRAGNINSGNSRTGTRNVQNKSLPSDGNDHKPLRVGALEATTLPPPPPPTSSNVSISTHPSSSLDQPKNEPRMNNHDRQYIPNEAEAEVEAEEVATSTTNISTPPSASNRKTIEDTNNTTNRDGNGDGDGDGDNNANGLSKPKSPVRILAQQNALTSPLPDDFLRIPEHQALKLPVVDHNGMDTRSVSSTNTSRVEWKIVAHLEQDVMQLHAAQDVQFRQLLHTHTDISIQTAVFRRDLYVGLGMQLREGNGYIYVAALTCPNGERINNAISYQAAVESGIEWEDFGPAFAAGIKAGDQVLGVNGIPFLRWDCGNHDSASLSTRGSNRSRNQILSSNAILSHAADVLRSTGDPVVLHILRDNNPHRRDRSTTTTTTTGTSTPSRSLGRDQIPPSPNRNEVRTFPSAGIGTPIRNRDAGGIMYQDGNASPASSRKSQTPTKGKSNSSCMHPLIQSFVKKGLSRSKKEQTKLSNDLIRFTKRASMWSANSYLRTDHFKYYTGFIGYESDKVVYPALEKAYVRESLDFGFVRQGLCIHIVNTFVDRDRLVFTIWVFDVESGTEWYAPVRYFKDFEELRIATLALSKSVEKLPFPSSMWLSGDETNLSLSVKDGRSAQLEDFLRGLCNLVYTGEIGSSTSEIALYVQTFLGCDNQLMSVHMREQVIGMTGTDRSHQQLSQAIKLYTYRLFLLPTFKALFKRFVNDVKRRATLIDERKTVTIQSAQSTIEKEKIIGELVTIKHVFSNIWNLIIDGCQSDLDAIANSQDFSIIGANVTSPDESLVYREALYRESIREQIEIHLYVPLRSTVSRLLVHGWRYDDKIFAYKVQALRRESQSFFKISLKNQSPSAWASVVHILSSGVGRSTLPCNKLKAIVNASKEIGRLSSQEHPGSRGKKSIPLGADDFLPIFIYCVINANIDRPCALCALLRNLCDETQQIGEVGYYLSTFEATIVYIHELDLTEA